MERVLIFFAVFILWTSIHFAQEDWKISGQIQLRSELDGRDFSNKSHPLTFASLRTRVAVSKTFIDKIDFFAQLQDSRVFGEEGNTLASIDNVDLHQGYVTLKKLFDWDLDVQAGRFEAVYVTERFFGAVGWHYIGRAWDGVRFKFYPGFKLDLFALTHTESVSYISNAIQSIYNSQSTPSYSVYGIWESMNLSPEHQLDFFAYYELNREKQDDEFMLDRYTLGFNHFGAFGSFSTIAEGAYQFGKMYSADVSAYLISLQGTFNTGRIKIGGGADIISGADEKSLNSGRLNIFSPTFGTNHKFYGYMDYFINIPANTYGVGLNDYYLNLDYVQKEFAGSLNLHHFTSNTKPDFGSTFLIFGNSSVNKIDNGTFGQEIDLTFKYFFEIGTTITWGGSVFIPGELMKLIYNPKGADAGFWSYIMITANI